MSVPVDTTTRDADAPTSHRDVPRSLRNLYAVRFVFALAWAVIMVATSARAVEPNAGLTALLIVYPLFDAGAVLWQLRADPRPVRAAIAEWINVVVSLGVAVALAVAASLAIPAALAVWGVWAIVAGAPQLVAAIRNRRNGGQAAQMLSGGLSVFAGAAFLVQGLQGSTMIIGVAGYAALGAIFFALSALRLSVVVSRQRS